MINGQMIYRKIEPLGIALSAIGLGGHEYMLDGSSRGFNEDFIAPSVFDVSFT